MSEKQALHGEPDVAALMKMSEAEQIAAFQRSPEYLKWQSPALPVSPKTAPAPARTALSRLRLEERDGETEPQAIAHAVTNPAIRAATSLSQFAANEFGEIDINTLTADVVAQSEAVTERNDLGHVECMLIGQAKTLEAIFHSLAHRASGNLGNTSSHWFELYLRMALKAQSQCRTTLETLALIKNPKAATFVRQANIANGPQQVNNKTRARKSKSKAKKRHSKLLER